MDRTRAIEAITRKLSTLDDEGVMSLAEHAEDMADAAVMRSLTERELELVESAKRDFETGQTLSLDEAKRLSDQIILGWRSKAATEP